MKRQSYEAALRKFLQAASELHTSTLNRTYPEFQRRIDADTQALGATLEPLWHAVQALEAEANATDALIGDWLDNEMSA